MEIGLKPLTKYNKLYTALYFGLCYLDKYKEQGSLKRVFLSNQLFIIR